MNVRHPYGFDTRGRTAEANDERYIRGLIEQVLFTSPGERVMRPDFGSGLMQLVFAPISSELVATVKVLAQGALQQWLGSLITIQALEVTGVDSTLQVTLQYVIHRTQTVHVETFERGASG